ncbi:MAG: site-specific integrase, partial [Candidatus Caldatribacteriota bacterium]
MNIQDDTNGKNEREKDLIENFLEYLSLERGLSANTIISYRYDLLKYYEFIVIKNRLPLKDVDREAISQYYHYLNQIKLAVNSIFRNLVALKMFYRFLFTEGYIKNDLTRFIEFPRLKKKLPETLNMKELNRLLAE